MNAAFIKDLTGGDEQTARGIFQSKSSFVFYGSPHILCNRIPELEDIDGGMEVRIRCIPYEARFVHDASQLNAQQHVYLIDSNVDANFDTWKYWFMHMLIDAYCDGPDDEPDVVKEHTFKLLDRDDTVKNYTEDRIVQSSNDKDVLLLKDVYADYLWYCTNARLQPVKKAVFEEDLSKCLKSNMVQRTAKHRKFWYGFQINDVCLM